MTSAAYIGCGSPVIIAGRKYHMTTTLSGAGQSANEVYLTHRVSSGDVQFIGNRYSHKPITVGEVMPAGLWLDGSGVVAVNDNICFFWAGAFNM
jgi:hypothetical protein